MYLLKNLLANQKENWKNLYLFKDLNKYIHKHNIDIASP